MILPRPIVIADRKIAEYLLTARTEDDKSMYLALAGYAAGTAARLKTDLLSLATGDARFLETTEYGDKYEIHGRLIGPNGKMLAVVTIWMHEETSAQTKFITLYPNKE